MSRPFNVAGERVLDLLCKGKRTVVPPTIHPSTGKAYVWLTDDALEHVLPENLPELPPDIGARLQAALEPFGYETPAERPEPTGDGDSTWREINDLALLRLSSFRLANQRIGFLRFAACADSQSGWHGGKVSGYGER